MPFSKPAKIAAAILLYIVFLIANLPASQVVSRVSLPSSLNINGVSGTLWNGHANVISVNGIRIFNAEWHISPLSLLWGVVTIDIDAGNQRQSDQVAVNGRFGLSMSSLSAEQATIFIPTDMVIANLPIPIPVNASGRFKVTLKELQYEQVCQELEATGEWLNSGVMGTKGNIPLGNFKAALTCNNDAIAIQVAPQNQLGLDATATLSGKGDIEVLGKFRVAPELPKEVHDAARFFGQPDADGFYQIKF